MSDAVSVAFRLNGALVSVEVSPETRLAEILREMLGQTATKIACGIGRCGACMALVDGRAVNSCLVMAYQLDSSDVVTGEGLGALPVAAVVRAAFDEAVSFQCGYCAPGFVVALTGLLLETPDADAASIRQALEGNLCRCSGYLSILRGAERAVAMLAELNNQEIRS
jgi:carbon-monoxide dehydrogenase small subunit